MAFAPLLGCAAEAPGEELDGPEPVSDKVYALGTVEEAVTNGCSTVSVWGLSEQIVAQVNCLVPNAYKELPSRPNISNGAAVFPFMQAPAVDHLIAAVDAHTGSTLQVTSMLRTVAQQYLLYRWSLSGSCGVSVAATPGNSNHESGLALDVSNYSTWRTALEANSFTWYGSSDAVHFTYTGPGKVDLAGQDVLAFQMLWNINHPSDKIDEDGDYGPDTEARLKASPADGFPIPPDCNPNDPPAGNLDEAGCERVVGWAQDPDEPAAGIGVHVYFGGPSGDPAATGIPTVANLYRDDLCTPLGSCEHGFALGSPLSLHDGQPHAVHAYAIDSQGGDNAQVASSPRTLQCTTAIPPGVRRHVATQDAMTAWHFTPFWDVMPVSDAALSALAEGDVLPDQPKVVKADDGTPEVWLVDGAWRRHVPDPAVAAAWEFDLGAVQTIPAAELYGLEEGTDVRARPFLIQASGPAVYLMDDDQTAPVEDGGTGSTGGTGGAGGSGGEPGDSGPGGWPESDSGQAGAPSSSTTYDPSPAEGCACESAGRPAGRFAWLAAAAIALAVATRRRK